MVASHLLDSVSLCVSLDDKGSTFRTTDKSYISSVFTVLSLCQVSFRFDYQETCYLIM